MPQYVTETPSYSGEPASSSLSEPDSTVGVTSSSSTGSDSKLNSGSSSMSDREENFECYGGVGGSECETDYPSLRFIDGGDSNTLMTPPHSLPPSNFSRRNSFARRSLRITPSSSQVQQPRRWGSFRNAPKIISGTSVASQLYRTSPLSSGRSSSHDQEEMYSDESLEDNVQDLSHKVQMLTQQMGIFADNQVSIDDRYSRVQQENAVLRERITMLEEQQREKQMRADDRLAEEQKRNKELISRIEREKQLTVENHVIKNRSFEKEKISLEGETQKLKAANERLIKEKSELEDRISDLEYATKQLQQENSKVSEMAKREKEELRIERERSYQVIEELRSEVERLRAIEEAFRKRSPSNEYMSLNPDLEIEVKILREKNHNLNEQMEDLQAQLLTCQLEEGRTLITANNNSLAAEFELMTIDEGAQIATENDKLKNSLRDSQEANLDLRSYIDAILLNVVENYPQLLEVKRK